MPLRPDGFGYVLPTPPELVDRRLPTVDLLPPPSGEFESDIRTISSQIRRRMGKTWSPSCPVTLAQLRYVTVSFWGFDGKSHTGELVINRGYAADIVEVFQKLYAAKFPIEEMRLVTTADVEAEPTGDTNNTSAYVCRAAVGQTRWSEHAYGRAIDVNPFHNPYVNDDLVLPELASAYLDRSDRRPGMIRRNDVVVKAFADIGWPWGGDWRNSKDYQHFSSSGN
ncbi:MAG: M15 family metallopeptidase [Sporichthyaceae bacterium]|nr:M15 family metallopeptidase [Sporichthyaceae bacterium]